MSWSRAPRCAALTGPAHCAHALALPPAGRGSHLEPVAISNRGTFSPVEIALKPLAADLARLNVFCATVFHRDAQRTATSSPARYRSRGCRAQAERPSRTPWQRVVEQVGTERVAQNAPLAVAHHRLGITGGLGGREAAQRYLRSGPATGFQHERLSEAHGQAGRGRRRALRQAGAAVRHGAS